MPAQRAAGHPPTSAHVSSILALFFAWKALLLAVVAGSPGIGYDTSTHLLWAANGSELLFARQPYIAHLATRLVRWDAIYFLMISQRWYLYEQEWAFGRGFMWLVSRLASVLSRLVALDPLLLRAVVGVIVANAAHLLSVLLLYALTLRVLSASLRSRHAIARLAACLHILSPAGVFLSAPYTETTFALLNFLGFFALAYRQSRLSSLSSAVQNVLLSLAAGAVFATAALVRSNGLLSSLALGIPALHILAAFPARFGLREAIDLVGLGIGILLSAVGAVVPQYQGYLEFCTNPGSPTRPWCSQAVPSIFSFVQQYYWGVGFLNYWTVSNLPLFLVATPMLILLFGTATTTLSWSYKVLYSSSAKTAGGKAERTGTDEAISLAGMALPQLALAVLNLTSFHVQIVNRISSGYPLWYIVLATTIVRSRQHDRGTASTGHGPAASWITPRWQGIIVTTASLYAIIQAGLYSSFLPPA